MGYQQDVSKMQGAGFSGQEIQDWSDNQAVQLRQAGFSQDEVDQHQGMVPSLPGTPPVTGRVPTDKDFHNAATVILNGNDHPFYEKAVEKLKDIFSSSGVPPEGAVKAARVLPNFQQIMENGDDKSPTWGEYGTQAARGAGSAIAEQMKGLATMQAYSKADNPVADIEPGKDPEKYLLYQQGNAFQKWIDKNLPEPTKAIQNNPIKMGLVGGVAALPELIATGGLGMAAQGAGSGYEEARQTGASPEKSVGMAGKSAALWGVLGVVDVGAFIKPIERAAPGFLPWITAKATQAVRSGATFAGTNELGDYLSSQIAQSADIPIQYKPTLERVLINALTGAAMGPLSPSGVKKEVSVKFAGDEAKSEIPPGETPPPETPPPAAGGLQPAYHFDTDSYGLKNDKGEFVQTGFASEDEARDMAKMKEEKIPAGVSHVEPEVIERYKKIISDDAEKNGLSLNPEQLNNAAQRMAESHNPQEEMRTAPQEEPIKEEPAYSKIPKKPLGLADFVRKAGGVNDTNGEVRSILGGAKYRPGLINGEGRSIDDIALAAHESGYFPEKGDERPSVNEFLDKLNNDLHGRAQHSEHDADASHAYENALRRNEEVDRMSDETGIRAEGKTHTQFWDEVNEHLSRQEANEKKSNFSDQARDAYESWRTEALEPEEMMTKEELEHERTQDNIAKDKKSIAESPRSSGSTTSDTGKGEEVGGSGGRSAEPTGSTGSGEESAAAPASPGTGGAAKLPKLLAGAKPRYGFGEKQFTLSFENDTDKALYITSQKKPSKRDDEYRKFLKSQGLTDKQIDSQGQKVRAEIKRMVQGHPEFGETKKVSDLHVPDQSENQDLFYEKTNNRGILTAVTRPEDIRFLEDVDKFLRRVLPNNYGYELTPHLIKTKDGGNAYGLTDKLKNLIKISMFSPDQWRTSAHEAFHAIKDLLGTEEYKVLLREAGKRGLVEKYNIKERYDTNRSEETLAHWYGDWQSKQAEASKQAKNIFQKIQNIFKNIAAKIREHFGVDSAEDIFRRIESGEVGERSLGEGEGGGILYEKKYGDPTIGSVADRLGKIVNKKDEERPTIGEAIRGIQNTIAPSGAGELAKKTEIEIRQDYGEAKRERVVAETALNEYARQATKMTPDEHADFYNYVEGRSTGVQLKNKQFQAMADAVREVYKGYRDILQNMPETRMMNFIQDYFTHQWAAGQDKEVKEFMNSWWQQGSGRNLKERKIPTIADGLAYGLKLEEPNPVRAVSRYAGSMSNYIASVKLLRAISNDLGGSYYADGRQPQGYVPLVGRNAERIENARIDPESGNLIPARNLKLYAPQQVADLYNAFYSKGFEDTKLKSTYMLARDAINTNTMMELGVSLYHYSTITMQSLNQDMARILRNFVAGDWEGVGNAIKGLVSPGAHFLEGRKLLEQYKNLADHGINMEQTADHFAKANFRTGLDPLANVSTHGGFYHAMERGELPEVIDRLKRQLKEGYGVGALKSAGEVVSRIISDISHPLFNAYVPAIKMSGFHDLMSDWLRQHPGANDGEIAANRVRIADMVEDRFGEMNMENVFWNKKAKEIMGLIFRAPGWDLGLIRQVGGPVYDIYRAIKDGIKGKGFDDGRLDRPLFVVAAAANYMAMNAAATYIKTGVMPSDQELKDMIAYQTGGTHKAFGLHGERGELPGHGRELIQLAPIPGKGPLSGVTEEVGNKVATLPKKTFEAATNTDWNGKPIYDPKSPNWWQRIPGFAQAVHVASGFEPFSVGQSMKGKAEGSNLSLAERVFGVRAAGAKIVNPEGLREFNEKKKH